MPVFTKKEWTVLFLVQVQNQGDQVLFTPILDSLNSIHIDEKIEIIFCINFNSKFRPYYMGLDTSSTSGGFSTCLFRLANSQENDQVNQLSLIEEIDNFDITSEHDVGMLFIRKMANKYPAKKHLLCTWDHGNGYYIFKKQRNGFNSRLTTQKINRAIEMGLQGNKKMDVLVMMNCWMQLIDTPFALRDSVAYLIAPQNAIDLRLYDTQSIIKKMTEMPDISPHRLSKKIIQFIEEKESNRISTISICALQLKVLGEFFDLLDELAIGLKEEMNIKKCSQHLHVSKLKSIRDQFSLAKVLDTGHRFVDFYSLILNLKAKLNSDNNKICIRLLETFDEMNTEFFTNFPNGGKNEWDQPYGVKIESPFTISRNKTTIEKIKYGRGEDVFNTNFKQTAWGRLSEQLKDLDFLLISGQL